MLSKMTAEEIVNKINSYTNLLRSFRGTKEIARVFSETEITVDWLEGFYCRFYPNAKEENKAIYDARNEYIDTFYELWNEVNRYVMLKNSNVSRV